MDDSHAALYRLLLSTFTEYCTRSPAPCYRTNSVIPEVARLDSMQAESIQSNTDIMDDGSGSLHGSILLLLALQQLLLVSHVLLSLRL
jgi:hypothetical protein